MFSLAIFGGNRIDGSVLEPGEPLTCLVLFGGVDVDFTACEAPPLSGITVVSIFGGARVRVRADQPVRIDGLSLFGGRTVEPRSLPPPGEDPLPLTITAYSLFGGVRVERGAMSDGP